MQTGAITSYFDVAQIVLYAFWIFFAGLIVYLRREDKREGYPLISDISDHVDVVGYPGLPAPKVFRLANGETRVAPREEERRPFAAEPTAPWPGAPFEPTGNPLADGIGPAAWAMRPDVPDHMFDGSPKIVPLRAAADHSLAEEDAPLIGWTVVAADGEAVGTVVDVWVDKGEMLVRYLEVALTAEFGGRSVLLPDGFGEHIGRRHEVKVNAILGRQFAGVPGLQNPDIVTLREEDRISGYYGGGYLYATPARSQPLL